MVGRGNFPLGHLEPFLETFPDICENQMIQAQFRQVLRINPGAQVLYASDDQRMVEDLWLTGLTRWVTRIASQFTQERLTWCIFEPRNRAHFLLQGKNMDFSNCESPTR